MHPSWPIGIDSVKINPSKLMKKENVRGQLNPWLVGEETSARLKEASWIHGKQEREYLGVREVVCEAAATTYHCRQLP